MNRSLRLFPFWGLLLTVSILLFSGCKKENASDEADSLRSAEDARRAEEQRRIEAVFSDEIRSLSDEELAQLGARNAFPTGLIVPNALSVRLIQPTRFLQSGISEKVIRFLRNTPTLVPFWNQFDQLELLMTSTKIAPVSLFDPKSGQQIGENYPFPLQAVYARKTSPINQSAFLRAGFGDLPQDRIRTEEVSGLSIRITDLTRIVPLDAAGKNNARVDKLAMAVAFPSENEALMVNGPIDAVMKFFVNRDGNQRGVLAQRAGRLDSETFDFAFLYDYTSPQKDALTLPVPRDLAISLWENGSFLQLLVNAGAAEGEDALTLDITADQTEKLDKIDESIGNTLLQLGEMLNANPDAEENKPSGGISDHLPQLSDVLKSITKEKTENRITAVMKFSADREALFGNLLDDLNQISEESQKEVNRNLTGRNLEILGQLINKDYYAANNHFPPLALLDGEGNPLLSWRVALLPMMGQEGEALYKEFKLDQPWDSEENLKLLDRMPPIYRSPLLPNEKGKTLFRIFSGGDAPFQMTGDPLKIQNLENPGKTFVVVAVDPSQAVEWTKPDILEPDPAKFQEIFGDYVLAVPAMGELFSAPYTGDPSETEALLAWICGKTAEAGETDEPEAPEPNGNESPLEEEPKN